MKRFLPLLALIFVSCDEDTPAPDLDEKQTEKPAPAIPPSASSPETEAPTKSSRPREITPRVKKPQTGTWHAEKAGHVVSPYTHESLFAIGVISGSKMKDSEGNEFIVPPFGDSPITIYPTGKRIADRPGYIANPFNGEAVDVRGIPQKTLVRDPNDPDPDHKFRTPPAE